MSAPNYINAYHDRRSKTITVWIRDNDKRYSIVEPADYSFYVDDLGKEALSSMCTGNTARQLYSDRPDVHQVYCSDANQLMQSRMIVAATGGRTFEADIPPEFKVVNRLFSGVKHPTLYLSFLDIEVDYDKTVGFSSINNPYAPINSIAIHNTWDNKNYLIAVPPKNWDGKLDTQYYKDINFEVKIVKDEAALLMEMLQHVTISDGLVGWNSHFFDIPYIAKRLDYHKELNTPGFRKGSALLSFDGHPVKWREVERFGKKDLVVDLHGRLNIDMLELFKKFEMEKRHSYKLAAVSQDLLPDMQKLHYSGTLADLYNDNFDFFLKYNARDVECLIGFEKKLGYVMLANIYYHDSTGFMNNIGGTLRLADYAIISYCHSVLGVVVPDGDFVDGDAEVGDKVKAQGAFVLEPKGGFHELLASVDIGSLYPSSIRSVNISPEKLVGQFLGEVEDFDRIFDRSKDVITLVLEDTKEHISHPADKWPDILKANNWSVSGYGTVFNLDSMGVLPAILAMWADTRKRYQKLKEEAKEAKDSDLVNYYDKMQYCYKIKLNSLYGALLNKFFRFYDQRLGESTTGTGRAILRFQCSKVNELLTGKYEFYGDAVIYGDTDSTYFKTYAKTFDEAVVIGDTIAEKVNAAYPEFMSRAFFCNDNFNKYVKANREVIASSGIFVTRKRYVLMVKNLDGYATHYLKVMGLDIKKTILPAYVQDALSAFIERLLEGEKWIDISRDIVDLKYKMMDDNIMLLGLPKGANKIEHFTELVANEHRVPARVPGHVRAAINFNQKVDFYKDTESYKAVSGAKVNVFYLKVPEGKFKSIAIPVDNENVPSWFNEDMIDKELQIDKLINKPLGNILKAIGEEPPTRKTLFMHDSMEF